MTQLVLVIWESLVISQLVALPTEPVTATAPRNLSCYECFKVSRPTQCQPSRCGPSQQVCISNEVYIQMAHVVRVQISKRCAARCHNANGLYQWSPGPGEQRTILRRCCSGHLCNTAPVAPEGFWTLLGRLLLPMGLGLLCTLLPGPLSCDPISPTSSSGPPRAHSHPIKEL